MPETKPIRDFVIRPMRQTDCADVSRLQCASFAYGARLAGYGEDRIAAYWRDRGSLEAVTGQFEQCLCLVACRGGDIVGVIGVRDGEITKLYVDPAGLRQGIGAALFAAAEAVVARAGRRRLFLGTIFPQTVPFYQAMGMGEAGRRRVQSGPMAGAESILMAKSIG